MPRALLIKFGAIGDVVMAIPAAHALHQSGHRIDWVCGQAVAPLLALYPWINPIPVEERALLLGSFPRRVAALFALWRLLAGRRYDLVATLYYDSRYRLLALPVRARRKLMLSETDRATRLLPGRHHTDEYARILLNLPDGERPGALAPVRPRVMPATPHARMPDRPRIVLAPGGARNLLRDDALRRWPPEFYAQVARALSARGLDVVLIGASADASILPYFEGIAIASRIGVDTLPETVALLDAADVLLTHDTGPLHLAGITGVSIVALFGPTDPHGRLPRRPGAHAVWGGETFACRPCYDGHDYAPCQNNGCIRQIDPAMAVEHILNALAQRALPIAPTIQTVPISRGPEAL